MSDMGDNMHDDFDAARARSEAEGQRRSSILRQPGQEFQSSTERRPLRRPDFPAQPAQAQPEARPAGTVVADTAAAPAMRSACGAPRSARASSSENRSSRASSTTANRAPVTSPMMPESCNGECHRPSFPRTTSDPMVASAADMPDNFKACGELGTMFFGEKDTWVYVDRSGIKASDKQLLKTKFRENDFRFRKQRNHMTDFLDCIASREECIAPVNAGHRSASIGHLGKLACTLRSGFKWDPKEEVITDNPALNNMLTRVYRGDWSLEV